MFAPPKGRQPRTPTHLAHEENENSVAVRFRRAGALQEMERHQKNRYGEKVADVNVMDSLVPEGRRPPGDGAPPEEPVR